MGLKYNLLRISQLCDNENKVHLFQESCFIANRESGDNLLTRNRERKFSTLLTSTLQRLIP